MTQLRSSIITLIRAYWNDERGVTAAIVALFTVVMIGLSGMVIDFGHLYVVQRSLQASTDAAALAGGYNIPAGTGIATANTYSAQAGEKNANADIKATMVAGYPALHCYTTTGIICVTVGAQPSANAIQVKEQAVVPTYFLRILGLNSVTVTALATAGARGGSGQYLNVMIVLDTTASMTSSTDNDCGLGNGATREQCALAGVSALLNGLNPSLDYVGLMVFPGLVNSTDVADEQACGKTLPSKATQAYSNSPIYTIVGLNGSNNFKTSSTSKTLNASSDIVLAADAAGCKSGVTAPGGEQTYYAEAINAAQAALNSFAAPHTQNVIIFLSDGAANSPDVQTNLTGYISGTTLTVTACPNGCAASTATSQLGPVTVGENITGTGVTEGTTITKQLTGTTGGVGTYQVNNSQTVGSSRNPSSLTAANSVTFNGKSFAQNTNQCQQAIAAAQAAANAGTWVYSIAYGASTATGSGNNGSGCTTDSTNQLGFGAYLSSCTTMQNIANSPQAIPDLSKFYSNNNNGVDCPGALASNTIENLVSLFQNLSENLTEPRLLPDNTT